MLSGDKVLLGGTAAEFGLKAGLGEGSFSPGPGFLCTCKWATRGPLRKEVAQFSVWVHKGAGTRSARAWKQRGLEGLE